MKRFSVKTFSVAQLHRRFEDALFAIPRLQREFVWNGRKAAALLDSMYRGMPIGSVLVWQTGRASQYLLRKSLHILPPYSDANDRIWFLIDGQQRLSVIHQTFRGDAKFNSDGREVDFSRLTFSVANDAEENGGTLFHYRRPVEGHFVAITRVLSSSWRRSFRRLPVYKQARIEECRRRLLKYSVPFLFVDTGDIDEIRELFIRINSLGTPIGSADRAITRATAFDLRALAHEAKESLPPEFRNLPYETILQTFALTTAPEIRDVGERAYEAAIRSWQNRIEDDEGQRRVFERLWSRLRRAIGKAVDYLRANFGVRGESYLPSNNMVATLSVFFFHASQPQAAQRRELKRWFWATGVAQRYSGRGHRQNILKDAGFFRRLARGSGRFTLDERVDRAEIRRAEYNRRTSLSDTFFCLLLKREPRYVTSGSPVPPEVYVSAANRKHRHHIFPRALLAVNGFNHRRYNSICNICLIVAEENLEFGARRPDSYLDLYRVKRYFAGVMRSHLIPHRPESAIWLRGVRRAYPRFVDQRLRMICDAFEQAAGMRLFRRD